MGRLLHVHLLHSRRMQREASIDRRRRVGGVRRNMMRTGVTSKAGTDADSEFSEGYWVDNAALARTKATEGERSVVPATVRTRLDYYY